MDEKLRMPTHMNEHVESAQSVDKMCTRKRIMCTKCSHQQYKSEMLTFWGHESTICLKFVNILRAFWSQICTILCAHISNAC